MLRVKTPDEVLELIEAEFFPLDRPCETVGLEAAAGRVLAADILAGEYVPDFDRSTVDGYALRAEDTFGCSDCVPAILPLRGEVLMGRGAELPLPRGCCCAVPTGGALPPGADCAVMLEYAEVYGDGTVGITKPAAPGQNVIFRGDDVFPGKTVLRRGRRLCSQDIGALAAIGLAELPVRARLRVGLISTGDELVPPESLPGPGQVRDVNGPMLRAMLEAFGAAPVSYGIVRDDQALLSQTLLRALSECDGVLISGGSSVGVKDASLRVIESAGTVLLHGIAIKPGKPTIIGRAPGGKPLVGLPGHPVAAYFVSKLFVLPLLSRLEGRSAPRYGVRAVLSESVSANHGRAQYNCVRLRRENGRLTAYPIRSKSGLITTLAGADGFFCIDRDCEGAAKGSEIEVTVCEEE